MSSKVTAAGFSRRGLGSTPWLWAFVAASCFSPAPRSQAISEPPASRARPSEPGPVSVVLLALDGVRWQEVFHGVDAKRTAARSAGTASSAEALMPNLHGLVDNGGVLLGAPHSGVGVFASGPEFLSLPGYSEMLSGRRVTACKDNGCAATTSPTLADEVAMLPGAGNGDVAVVTSWPDIGRIAAQRADRVAMSTGRNGGPTRELFRRDPVSRALIDHAAKSSADPGAGDFRPDRLTARIAVHHLETAQPRFLFISLGEPDEYAHRGDYAGYLRALRHADLTLGLLSRALEERARQGARTVLFVTSDHGRAHDFSNHGRAHPESARVWLLAWGTEIGGRLAATGEHHLADLAPTLRKLFGLAEDRHPAAGRGFRGLLEGPRG